MGFDDGSNFYGYSHTSLHTLATLKTNRESPKSTEPDSVLLSVSDAYDDFTFLSRAVNAVCVHDV
jgi:hypothetical protein